MGTNLIIILFFLAFLATYSVYPYILSFLTPKRLRPEMPLITIEEAYKMWVKIMHHGDESKREIIGIIERRCSEDYIQDRKDELREIERKAKEAKNPLIPLRTSIMDAIDSAFLAESVVYADNETLERVNEILAEKGEHLFNKEDASREFIDSTIRYGVLRVYSWLKYADAEIDDWFDYYVWCVKHKVESLFTLFKEPQFANGLLYKSWDMLVEKIRPKLLETPRQHKWLTEELTLRGSDAQNATPEI